MAVRDAKFLPSSPVVVQTLDVGLDAIIGTSLTDRLIRAFKPGHRFLVLPAEVFARTVTGAVSVDVVVSEGDEVVIGDPNLRIGTTPERFRHDAVGILVGTEFGEVAASAAAGITFSAAHVVTALKFGAILVQATKAGVVSTKVVASPQAYDDAAHALMALPAPDAGNVALGYLVIEAGAGNWTANTDDLTPGGDLTAVTYVDAVVQGKAVDGLVPVAGVSTYSDTPPWPEAEGEATAVLLAFLTTDGTGDVTEGFLRLRYRPVPLNGES